MRFQGHGVLVGESCGRTREAEHILVLDGHLGVSLVTRGGGRPEGKARVRVAHEGVGRLPLGGHGAGGTPQVEGERHRGSREERSEEGGRRWAGRKNGR